MALREEIAALHDVMIEWRHRIHRHPETAYEEVQTGDMVAELLESWGIEIHRGLGKTGVVGVLQGREAGEANIGLRADMDALHMEELNDFDHRSQVDGKMHACGHDGHTTMLLGAAKYLAETRDFKGTVYFIFQPAEESEGGADAMIKDGLFERFPVSAVYGMHNWPAAREGVFCIKPGALMAANDRFELVISGQGGHAGMPHLAVDTIAVATQVVQALQHIASRQTDPQHSVVVSITQFHAGHAWNVLPEECVLRGTIRSLDPEVQRKTLHSVEHIAEQTARAFGASSRLTVHSGYPVTINDEDATRRAERAARSVVGDDAIITSFDSTMGSEDFSFMLQAKPGAYVFLGNSGERIGPNGSPCMLHNPYYDFNDNILPIGASYFVALVEQELPLP